MILLVISGIVASLTSIIGGYWMTNYKRKGVHLVLVGLVLGFLLQLVMSFSDSTQDMYGLAGHVFPSVILNFNIGLFPLYSRPRAEWRLYV